MSNQVALRLHEAGVQLEGVGLEEIVVMLGVAEREIERLQEIVDRPLAVCAGCGTTFAQCSTYWPAQKKCCPDCKCIVVPTKERMRILAGFLRSQIALADRPPVGRVELNNEEATVCQIALELLIR